MTLRNRAAYGAVCLVTGVFIAMSPTPAPASSLPFGNDSPTSFSGVSSLSFPLTPAQMQGVPGLTMSAPPTQPSGQIPAGPPGHPSVTPSGAHTQIVGTDYQWCGANADAPPQEIVDLAASMKNNWQLIYAYVYNNIVTEPTGESTKGALGTYLDQSGNSFDQSNLLVALLRAAGYQAQYVVGTATLTASQLGLSSVSNQLIKDAGGSGTSIPYAWVQVSLNGSWTTLDPANKTTTLLTGTNLSNTLQPLNSNGPQLSNIQSALNSISSAYSTSTAYGSLASFIGGSRINHLYNPPTGVRSGGTVYTTLPTIGYNYRTGIAFSGVGAKAIYFCTDQLYGHTLSFSNTVLYVDGMTVQSGFAQSNPVTITIWHPNAATPWGQAVAEALTNTGPLNNTNSVISLAAGQVRKFRAAHDANILNALQSVGPVKGANAALLAAGSSQLSQTAQLASMMNQLAGTYMINHHTLQIVRSNNSVDTPMTSTSIDQVTTTPASGLTVVPQAVSYALSAAQSAQEAVALTQAGSTQTVSAATLLGGYGTDLATYFLPASSNNLPPSYTSTNISPQQLSALSSFHNAGFDLLVPANPPSNPPSSSAPFGFIAMNASGTSEFVLSTANGVYKGAADISGAVPGLGAATTGGTAPEASPSAAGLNVDTGSGAVTFAAPLISIGSAAPYKLEFDLLYSSAADAQVAANAGNLTGRPEAAGVANNFESRATASSDGFPMVGSELTGPALPGVSAAYYLLLSGNAIANYYASGGSTSIPQFSGYANAVVGSWLLAASTNNVVSITRGLSSSTFYKLPWAGYITAQPSGDVLTQPSGNYLLTTAHGDKLAFNNADGQISSITSPTGVQTSFAYTSKNVGSGTPQASANFLSTVSVGSHSLSLGYTSSGAGTYLLNSIADETGRTSTFIYGTCFSQNSASVTTSIAQLCGLTKPDWVSGQPVSYSLGYGGIAAASGGTAVLLNSVSIVNAAQNGLAATNVSYDGARMMATGITNANNHTTTYAIAPDRSEVDDALGLGSGSVSTTYPVISTTGVESVYTDSTDPLGNVTTQRYNYAGQLLTKWLPDMATGCVYFYAYDAHGNPTSATMGPSPMAPNCPQVIGTSTAWDQTWNKPNIVTDALGKVTTYTYDPNVGTLTSIVHPAVSYLGNQVQPTESFTYYSNGQLKTATAADGEVTCYNYSANVLDLSQVIVDCGSSPHLNLTTAFGYDSVGNPNQIVSARGYTTGVGYDLARRPNHETTPPISAQGNGVWSTYQHYDLDGRLIETDKDPGTGQPLVATKITYDDAGNKLTQSLPTNDGTIRNTVYTYDADERLSTTTTPVSATVNQVKQVGYDNDSRLFQVFMNGVLTETHIYNGDSLPITVADGAATLNAQGVPTSAAHTIQYAYDSYDRLVTTTYADGTTEQLTLDKDGRITTSVSRSGLSTTLLYDAMSRVLKKTIQSFSAPFITTYDLVGRPLTVAYSGGTFSYHYDGAGRQDITTRPDNLVIGYSYDADGNTASITYPDSYIYTYAFDELDRMTDVNETPPGTSPPTLNLAHYTYDPLSRRTALNYGNNTSTAYGYDDFSGVNSIAHTFGPTSVIPGITYGYTRDYAERRQTDTVSLAPYIQHPSAAGTDTYVPNATNQYASINGQTLTYDTNGNLNSDPTAPLATAANPTSYVFDQLNRLTSATNTQHSATYTYDPFSRRRDKTVDGTQTVFVDDGGRTIADYTSAGAEIQHYVYGADATPIVTEGFSGGATYTSISYLYTDALGSVVFVANKAGAAFDSYNYSPFGEGRISPTTPYRYAGMRLDNETQLYYDNARYYSPKQGRFLSPDPIGVKGGINIYAYTENDPLNGTDLSGLEPLYTRAQIKAMACESDYCPGAQPRYSGNPDVGDGGFGVGPGSDSGIGSLFDDNDGMSGSQSFTVADPGGNVLGTYTVPDVGAPSLQLTDLGAFVQANSGGVGIFLDNTLSNQNSSLTALQQQCSGGSSSACTAASNMNLGGDPIFPVAARLMERGIPIIFASGYGATTLPDEWRNRPTLPKPFTAGQVEQALGQVIQRVRG